jgi:hypothetical protein
MATWFMAITLPELQSRNSKLNTRNHKSLVLTLATRGQLRYYEYFQKTITIHHWTVLESLFTSLRPGRSSRRQWLDGMAGNVRLANNSNSIAYLQVKLSRKPLDLKKICIGYKICFIYICNITLKHSFPAINICRITLEMGAEAPVGLWPFEPVAVLRRPVPSWSFS